MMPITKLPKGWELRLFPDVAEINPRRDSVAGLNDETPVDFVPMAAVDEESGSIAQRIERPLREVRRGYTFFREGDVIVAKITPSMENGKAAVAQGLTRGIGFGSTEFHVIRPRDLVISEWLLHFVRQKTFRDEAARSFTGSVGQQRVPEAFFEAQCIPVPPVDEQKRIVSRVDELLGQTRAARALRRSTVTDALALVPAALSELFGKAADRAPVTPLRELIAFHGGGTPSRSEARFWTGPIPWVSPKDMTGMELIDSEEHISPVAIESSAVEWIQPPAVLVVVRGMILARRFPVAITRIRLTLNQDMKALCPNPGLDADYLAVALRALEKRILGLVETAAHGTRRLPTQALKDLAIPVPPLAVQKDVAAAAATVFEAARSINALHQQGQGELDLLESALVAAAFRGEL